jgi:hypothetical protein
LGSARAAAGAFAEARISDQEILAVALDTGELVCRHQRSFAKHRTITALDHARKLRSRENADEPESAIGLRPLDRYDALIA